jgi:thioredoxin reductase (NADPH)
MTSRDQQYDVVIIGGGAAGLSGAVALARSRRSVLVVDAGQPRNAPADGVHNYLGREGTPPGDLLAIGRAELAGYGGEVRSGAVTAARRENDGAFRVTLDDGHEVGARRLLVATGLVDELPDLPGVAERWGRDVLHCPYCHGWEVRDQAIGILATGPTAVHQALLFRQLSGDVTFFRHTGPELPADEAEQLAALGVPMVDGEVAGLEVSGDRLTGIRLVSGEIVERSVVVVAPRFTARADVLASLGVEATEQEMRGHVVGSAVAADPTGATAVPGVWVAGNVSDMSAQVVVSAAAGMRAGAMINADLVMADARLAVAAQRSVAA